MSNLLQILNEVLSLLAEIFPIRKVKALAAECSQNRYYWCGGCMGFGCPAGTKPWCRDCYWGGQWWFVSRTCKSSSSCPL